MKVIWKYALLLDDLLEIELPVNSQVLTVQVQRGKPYIWVLVDPNEEKETRRFRLAGTGHKIKSWDTENYIGTFKIHGGALVFHLFELNRESK